MKKLLVSVLAILSAICFVFAAACVNDAGSSIKIVGFEDQEITVAFGSVYLADAVATDEDGNEYATTVTAVDIDGNAVEVFSSKFPIVSKGYTVTYTAKVGSKTYTKVDTLKVVAGNDPIITVDATTKALMLGETYTLPTASAYDYFDGAITSTAEVYKEVVDGDDVKCDLDDGGLTFTATETGKYYVKFMAANSAERTAEKTVDFHIRALAVDGEWDMFDDEGAVYTTLVNSSAVKSVGWEENFNGRDGVLKVDIAKNNAYSTTFMAVPKVSDKAVYENYEKFVINMYIDGEEGALQNFRFCHPNIGNLPIEPVYGGWVTYVFNTTVIMNNWQNFARDKAATVSTNNHITGTYLKDCTIYIDSIYFANAVDTLEGSSVEENGVVTLDYSVEGEQLGYTVLYDGKWVEVDGNTFKAEYAGEYVVQPVILNSNSTVYAGAPITYNSVSANKLEVNEYDKTIALGATEYTLPQVKVVDGNGAEVDGYSVSVKTVYRGYANNIEERAFSTASKGWFEYIVTAAKEGEKTLYYNANIKVGDYIEGEIFNVNDADAAVRVGSMFMGATYSQVDGEEIHEDYAGEKFLKIATNLNNAYLTKTGYFNFNPSATVEDISDFYDVIKVKFYVKGKVKEGATAETMTVTFLGQPKVELKLNDWTEISVNVVAFENVYNKLCIPATWGDYGVTFGNMNYANFDEFAIYMTSITADTVEIPEDVIVVNENTYTQYNNPDIKMTYVSAAELANAGLSGDYAGNAVKWSHSGNNSGYGIINPFSKRQLNEIKNMYSSVEINFAVGAPEGCTSYVLMTTQNSAGAPSLISVANGGSGLSVSGAKYNVWNKMYIPIDDFVEFAYGKSNLSLFRTYADDRTFSRDYYFGDIKLLTPEEEPPVAKEIVKVTSASSYVHNDYKENYLDAAGVAALGFSGNYEGAAVYYVDIARNTGFYQIAKPQYTESQIENIKAHYSAVKFNVAMHINPALVTTDSKLYYNVQEGIAQYCEQTVTSAGKQVWQFNQSNMNTWLQFTVSIEDYIAYIESETGATLKLFKYHYSEPYNFPTEDVFTLYLGDIEFVEK